MDYKKIIIINLAFLIILGKMLQFIFNKMQRNLSRIDVDKNELLKFIFNHNYSDYISEDHKISLLSFDNLQKFKKDFDEISTKYEFVMKVNQQLDEVRKKSFYKLFILFAEYNKRIRSNQIKSKYNK
jgi:hypothetical protein